MGIFMYIHFYLIIFLYLYLYGGGCVWGVLIFSIEFVRSARGFQDHPKSVPGLNTTWAEGVHLCYGCLLGNIAAVPLVLVPSFPFDPPAPVFYQFHQFHLEFKLLVPVRLDWYLNTAWCHEGLICLWREMCLCQSTCWWFLFNLKVLLFTVKELAEYQLSG